MRNIDMNHVSKAAIAHRGNWNRMKRCMQRAEEGNPLVLGFIGGSITQGSLATAPDQCYAALVDDWWVRKFPNTCVTYINAGIGGTNSQFATARVEEDLLCKKPDVVVVEFSVNDENNEHYKETYESLIRKIDQSDGNPAILIVNNVCYTDGHNAEEQHVAVGAYYDLPCISMKHSIYELIVNGSITREDITPDGLHPNDQGHRLIADIIASFLETIYEEREVDEVEIPTLCQTLTKNRYAITRRYQNHTYDTIRQGFQIDERPQQAISDAFKKGWYARKVGASIQFRVTGTELAIQYRKTIHKPAPIAIAILDGDNENAVRLDANFEETWGDCLYLQQIGSNLKTREHTIEIKIIEVPQNVASDFYLVSILTGEQEFSPFAE